MPHDHDHDHDHDHGDCCDHANTTSDLGPDNNLFPYIDLPNVVALNATAEGSRIIKPWHKRMEEDPCLESDADDQLIIRVPFTGSVKLLKFLLRTENDERGASKVQLFANEPSLDFSDIDSKTPSQEFDVAETRDVSEYSVKSTKFGSVSSVTVFIPSSRGADSTKLFYLGFLGQWSQHRTQPVISVYETQANLADHEKIQGTAGNFHTTQS